MPEQGFPFTESNQTKFDAEIVVVIAKHDWENFVQQLGEINVSWVKEFYTHIEKANDQKIYVQGCVILLSTKAINAHFGLLAYETN
ncbi:hypothetical protein V6N13_001398 [Hibiscus sabdariffa]